MKHENKTVTDGEAKILELTADLQRTRADFENFRKQIEAQKMQEKEAVRFATICKILPILDDLDRAFMSYKELEPLKKSLQKTLSELNLTKIDSAIGVEFDPDLHEAVSAEGEGEKEVIIETLRPGYYYGKEILRPAMVKVGRTS